MKKNTIRVSDKYIRSLIREAIENMPDMPVSTDDMDVEDGMGAETTGEDDEEPVSENGGQIRLSESQLREFVSYSVARLLRESRYLRAPEGDGSFELDFGPYEQDGMEEAVNQAMAKSGLSEEWLEENDPFPVKVRISYGITPGSDDDQVLGLPGNTDDTELTGWEIISPVDPSINGFVREAVGIYLKSVDFDLDGELVDRGILRESAENPGSQGMYAGNRGLSEEEEDDEALNPVLTGSHEKVGSLPDIPNKYEGMTWDEYVEAKKREREEDERKTKKGLDPVLKGGKGGSFGGNRKSDDKRKDEGKVRLTSGDISEMVAKTVRKVLAEGGFRGYDDLSPTDYYKDDIHESASKRKPVNEISKGLLDRARESAHKDMMRNFGDYKTRQKRERQWNKFSDEYIKMDRQEKDSICPQVDERDLPNMPAGTYVVMDGDGRDAISANFRTRYSGHAGTKEQCEEYVDRFYDKGANWEYLPEIVPLEDYLNSKRGR